VVENENIAQPDHWNERERAASVDIANALGAPRQSVLQFAVAAAVGDDNFDGFFVDIKADELIVSAHVLVSYIGVCVGEVSCRASLHHAALFAFAHNPRIGGPAPHCPKARFMQL
jgi:hypothetical protein